MTFAELRTALSGRGFARLGTTLLGDTINDARAELDDLDNWPYLEASAVGTAPLAITDLKEVDEVFLVSPTIPLYKRSYTELVNDFGDVSAVGVPWFWYRATPSGVPTVATYPVSSSRSIGVQYWKVSPVLSADADVPLAPARYHSLIVLIAERMAHSRKGDLGTAQGLQLEVDRVLQRMRASLFADDAPVQQMLTGESVDG